MTTVTLSKEQYDALVNRLDRIETSKAPKRVTDRTATIRLVDDKPVVRYGKTVEVSNAMGRSVLMLEVFTQDAEEPTLFNYLDFLNGHNVATVKILKQYAEEHVQSQGQIRAQNPDEAAIAGKFTPKETDLEVRTVTYTVDVEFVDGPLAGQQLTGISTTCLNV